MNYITRSEARSAQAGIIIFAQSMEKFMRVMKEYYIQEFERGKDYQGIVNGYFQERLMAGASRQLALTLAQRDADQYVRNTVADQLENHSDVPYGKFFALINQVIDMSDEFTAAGMENNTIEDEAEKAVKSFDWMMEDSYRMCRLFTIFQNIDGKDNAAECAAKQFMNREVVSEEFNNKWYRSNDEKAESE